MNRCWRLSAVALSVALFGFVTQARTESARAGIAGPALIGGYVYFDLNNDGIKENGEGGYSGATITLTGPENHVTTTDAFGSYVFPVARAGSYTITETQPAPGFLFDGLDAVGSQGGTLANDVISGIVFSAADIQNQVRATGYDFGELFPSELSGFVYEDRNNDGIKQPGEPGIPGVSVTLTGTSPLTAPVNTTVVTSATGWFDFFYIGFGTYTIIETQPAGYSDGVDTAGGVGGTVGNDVISNINLPLGTWSEGYLFGELPQPAPTATATETPPKLKTQTPTLTPTSAPSTPTPTPTPTPRPATSTPVAPSPTKPSGGAAGVVRAPDTGTGGVRAAAASVHDIALLALALFATGAALARQGIRRRSLL